ncbi:unnamed protein product [Calypogeia fissa]
MTSALGWTILGSRGCMNTARRHKYSSVEGTYGYLAPELLETLKFTEKTDVYSFGALALEVGTGERPLLGRDNTNYDDLFHVDWV